MSDWVVDNLFGSWGRPVLDFYLQYSLPINLVVVAYGVALLVWHLRLRPYRRVAVREASRILWSLDAVRRAPASAARSPQVRAALAGRLDWTAIVREAGEGGLAAGRWGLWPRRVTADSLPRLLSLDELTRDALAARPAASSAS